MKQGKPFKILPKYLQQTLTNTKNNKPILTVSDFNLPHNKIEQGSQI